MIQLNYLKNIVLTSYFPNFIKSRLLLTKSPFAQAFMIISGNRENRRKDWLARERFIWKRSRIQAKYKIFHGTIIKVASLCMLKALLNTEHIYTCIRIVFVASYLHILCIIIFNNTKPRLRFKKKKKLHCPCKRRYISELFFGQLKRFWLAYSLVSRSRNLQSVPLNETDCQKVAFT